MTLPLVPETTYEGDLAVADRIWLDTPEAAKYIGSTPGTMENWRYVGGGPRYAKLGRRVTYRRTWLDDWLERRAVTSTAEARRNGWR